MKASKRQAALSRGEAVAGKLIDVVAPALDRIDWRDADAASHDVRAIAIALSSCLGVVANCVGRRVPTARANVDALILGAVATALAHDPRVVM